ncbi:Predicted arabinose efflux permease, MFS family [Andreprevotia lacus DSM 23236]|jgi:MFS family permease|uniref:Predicted arabinose efflux permease, MFS family n=1 Tax=Andreprevotia lacus DSM 23236 TaxID=1121001 RepID=A0A1W1XAZ3_9NEIS|nr:MFS transporter [Andreprevotia lacus]SMC21029.1 Predicted arabinose efflux permease, MFS family [Andreprevotia lacus DSM 23236]
MNIAQRNIRILALCQGLFVAAISIDLTLTGLAGYTLASDKAYATLPFALITFANMLTALVSPHWQQKVGRRLGFATGSAIGAVGAGLSVLAMYQQAFWLFCIGTACIGVFQAFAGYYRLAAADNVTPEAKSRAIATVLTGGVIAAVCGPWLAKLSQGWVPHVAFAGAYALASLFGIVSLALLLLFYRDAASQSAAQADTRPPRPLGEIVRQPVFMAALANNVVAYTLMVCIMTATPLAMIACGFGVNDGAGVIQWHMLGMFAPSFFSGWLIQRFGPAAVSITGALLTAACALIGQTSNTLPYFYAALLLLGLGWNFMFVAGTTLLTQSYRPSERAKTQSGAEFTTGAFAATASFAAAPLVQHLGWGMLNRLLLPLLVVPVLATLFWQFGARRRALAC